MTPSPSDKKVTATSLGEHVIKNLLHVLHPLLSISLPLHPLIWIAGPILDLATAQRLIQKEHPLHCRKEGSRCVQPTKQAKDRPNRFQQVGWGAFLGSKRGATGERPARDWTD